MLHFLYITYKGNIMAKKVKKVQLEMSKYYEGYKNGYITQLEYIELTLRLNCQLKQLVR